MVTANMFKPPLGHIIGTVLSLLFHITSAPPGENCYLFLQMQKHRHREAKFLAQAHTANKPQSWDSGWGSLPLCAVSYFTLEI